MHRTTLTTEREQTGNVDPNKAGLAVSMAPQWESNAFAKIHEGCGGLVRWVEAYDRPSVGYTGECVECGRENIPVENIIPIRADSGQTGMQLVSDVQQKTLAGLEWDDDEDFTENQALLREEIGKR